MAFAVEVEVEAGGGERESGRMCFLAADESEKNFIGERWAEVEAEEAVSFLRGGDSSCASDVSVRREA